MREHSAAHVHGACEGLPPAACFVIAYYKSPLGLSIIVSVAILFSIDIYPRLLDSAVAAT